jgi:AP-4 complex subunit mu-1
MFSQLFVQSSRGDVLVFRDYRGDVDKETPDIFFSYVQKWKDEKGSHPPPIINQDKTHFLYIRRNNLYFVGVTKFNIAPGCALELLGRIAQLCKDYCGVLNEESLRLNFVLVYELLDETLVRYQV